MCQDPLHDFLIALPKCEHHLHIEGALSPELLFELAAKNSIELPPVSEDAAFASAESLLDRYTRFTSLDDFLSYYFIGMRVLITASDFEALGWSYFQKAHAHNVRHAEVFFDPQAHISRGVAYQTVVDGLTKARLRAEAELGMSTALIICVLRHFPVPDCTALFETARDAGHFGDGTLVGLGMSSSEMDYPPGLFKSIYDEANAAGIKVTAHAGEEGPPSYVADSISLLGVRRVDHGRRATEDPALLSKLAAENIMLTLCPLSNRCLGGVASVADMPIRQLLDAGVPFSLNGDDPAYFGGYIQENYCAVQDAFGLDVAVWQSIAKNALNGSWCSDERKATVSEEIDDVVGNWKSTTTTS
jgi:adenosine deaminase